MNYTQLFNNIFKKRILKHVMFWLVNMALILIPLYIYKGYEEFILFLPRLTIIYIYIAISVYINLYFLIPKYLNLKKYWYFGILQLLNIALFTFLKIFTKLGVLKDDIDYNLFEEITNAITVIIIYLIITATLKYLVQFLKERISYHQVLAELKEMERQKLEVELNTLKAQLNPHFMFNTLNNIY